jgi:S-DNA-T family DNA segregation ATPase FtsK/SpoIIIE
MFTPGQVNIYVINFGDFSLKSLEGLPHVGGVANRTEAEKIYKLLSMLRQELSDRGMAFAAEDVGNIETYRKVSGKNLPYIALVVDNFSAIQATFPDLLDDFFLGYVRDGGGLGMFLVASSGTVSGMGFKTAQYINQSLALQMNDKSDYISIVGRTEGLTPAKVQGRGLLRAGIPREYQTALAIKTATEQELRERLPAMCAEMSSAWGGAVPAGIPVMPEIVAQSDLRRTKDLVGIGLNTDSIQPVEVAFESAWFMVISGMPKCGKSNMLRLLLTGLLQDAENKVTVYEPRDAVFQRYEGKINRITAPEDFDAFMDSLIETLKERKAAFDAGQGGFGIIAILIDDYELCFDKADDKTIARLTQITKLAKGLGVYLYVAGKAASMTSLYNQGDSLTMQLVSGPRAVALGGDLLNHPHYVSDLSTGEKTIAMGQHEGYFFEDGKAVKFRSALAPNQAGKG